MTTRGEVSLYIAACCRVQHLALAVVWDHNIMEVRRHRLQGVRHVAQTVAALIREFARKYATEDLVIEPTALLLAAAQVLHLRVHTLRFSEVKQFLIGEHPSPTHSTLYHELLHRRPELRRFVMIPSKSGHITITDRWRTVMLLAVALGLAHARRSGAS